MFKRPSGQDFFRFFCRRKGMKPVHCRTVKMIFKKNQEKLKNLPMFRRRLYYWLYFANRPKSQHSRSVVTPDYSEIIFRVHLQMFLMIWAARRTLSSDNSFLLLWPFRSFISLIVKLFGTCWVFMTSKTHYKYTGLYRGFIILNVE